MALMVASILNAEEYDNTNSKTRSISSFTLINIYNLPKEGKEINCKVAPNQSSLLLFTDEIYTSKPDYRMSQC